MAQRLNLFAPKKHSTRIWARLELKHDDTIHTLLLGRSRFHLLYYNAIFDIVYFAEQNSPLNVLSHLLFVQKKH